MENPWALTLDELEKELKIRKARTSYLDYLLYTTPGYIASKFHSYLSRLVQNFIDNPSPSSSFDILLVSIPPQHGKSKTITEALPSFVLGRNPRSRIIIGSYNEDFAIQFGRRNLDKLLTYGPTLFPECVLRASPCSNVEFETTAQGRCISRGIMSGITGNPADLIIIDDPIKNREEADSASTREKLWGEWLSTIRTRIAPGGKVIIIQTRWHEEDLFGRVQQNEKNVTVINIPCECEDPDNDPLGRQNGEALCPEIGRGNDWLAEYKSVYLTKDGSRAWRALYQGSPVQLEGNILKREWWKFYDTLPEDIPYKIISVDAAFKGNSDSDFVAIQVWGKKKNTYYLIDALKQRLDFVGTLAAIRAMRERYSDTLFVLIEDKANGTAIINVLSAEMVGVIPVQPEGGKESRARAITPAIESGRVFLPRFAQFTGDFIDECSAFPNSSHDDQVDAMSQALNRMLYVDFDNEPIKKIRYTRWTDDMIQDYDTASATLQVELLEKWGVPEQWRDDEE